LFEFNLPFLCVEKYFESVIIRFEIR
jgi:hypothetical protein